MLPYGLFLTTWSEVTLGINFIPLFTLSHNFFKVDREYVMQITINEKCKTSIKMLWFELNYLSTIK